MPPLSMAIIENFGEQILEELHPGALQAPTRLDLAEWAEYRLQQYNIFVSPASALELGDRVGATDPTDNGDGAINILIEEGHYDELIAGGRQANMARGTLGH